ncbi:MAG TPA: hypothetical protein VIV07_07975 [Sphingomicrobium sp.]
MIEENAVYFRRRALQEQLAAQTATCKVARDRHDELAAMYRFRAAMLRPHPRSWAEALQEHVELA